MPETPAEIRLRHGWPMRSLLVGHRARRWWDIFADDRAYTAIKLALLVLLFLVAASL